MLSKQVKTVGKQRATDLKMVASKERDIAAWVSRAYTRQEHTRA